jgi:hypothetical protein
VEVGVAIVLLEVVEEALLDDLEVGEGLRERGPDIVAPVGGTIADHGASEVDLDHLRAELGLQVVLIDLPGEIWHVDASIGLTRDEDFVLEVLGELGEEFLDGFEGIL